MESNQWARIRRIRGREKRTMKRIGTWTFGALLGLLVVSCGSSSMTGVWSDPTLVTAPVHKVLVIGLGSSVTNTKLFEGAMAKQLQHRKIESILASNVMPSGNAPIDTVGLRAFIKQNKVDLITVTRVVGVSKEREYVQGTTYYTPAPGYAAFYPYYYGSYAVVSDPGYMREYHVATVETNAYATSNEKLVWSGQSKTVDPASVNTAIDEIAGLLVSEMAKSGVLK